MQKEDLGTPLLVVLGRKYFHSFLEISEGKEQPI